MLNRWALPPSNFLLLLRFWLFSLLFFGRLDIYDDVLIG
jgi:hypothetical protein